MLQWENWGLEAFGLEGFGMVWEFWAHEKQARYAY